MEPHLAAADGSIFKSVPLKRIDDLGIPVGGAPLVAAPIGHVGVAMHKIAGVVPLEQGVECPEAGVRQVLSIPELVGRGMGQQDVESAVPLKLKPQLARAIMARAKEFGVEVESPVILSYAGE